MKHSGSVLRATWLASSLLIILSCGGDDDAHEPSVGGSGAQAGAGGVGGLGGSGGSGGSGGTDQTGGTAGTGGTGAQGGASGTGATGGAGGVGGTGGGAGQAGTGGAAGCVRAPGPDDFERKIVVARNKGPGGVTANVYEVLNLSTSGQISRPGVTFEMGPGDGEIVFTPDGEVGITLQDQGPNRSLGVFRFDAQGNPEVVHAAFKPSFYPKKIIMHPSGAFAYILDAQWIENGGGIYRVDIGCDGTLTEGGKILEAKLVYDMVLLEQNRVFLTSTDILGSSPSEEAHLIDLGTQPTRLASSDAFGDDESLVAAAAVTPDGHYGLLTDDSMFGGERVGVVRIDGNSLAFTQVLSPVPAPVSIVSSPNNDLVLVVSEFPDDLWVIDYNASSPTSPFSLRGKLAYVGNGPALPSTAVMIERGSLAGRVLIQDLYGVRQVQFTTTGAGIQDIGQFETGQNFENNIGALGVQK